MMMRMLMVMMMTRLPLAQDRIKDSIGEDDNQLVGGEV